MQLSEHFSYRKLLRFTLPSIIMMIFTSIYGVIDGLFVSNFAGKTAFTAVNFVMPVLMILGAVGFMFGTGGSAIIAKTMGEGKLEEAKKQFSMFVYAAAVLGIILAVLGLILIRPVVVLLGAKGEMLELGLKVTVIAGVTNIVLDALFVGLFPLGVVGAAATVLSQCVGGIVGMVRCEC